MAGENHLTYFKVQNFKRFKELEVKDIGQFNLVLGDNNVGKTSFLEALLFDYREKPQVNVLALLRAFDFRNFGSVSSKNFLRYILNADSYYRDSESEIRFSFHEQNRSDDWSVVVNQRVSPSNAIIRNNLLVTDLMIAENVFIPDLLHQANQFPIRLIPFAINYSSFLTDFYGGFLSKDKVAKSKFFKSLQSLFPEIERLEPAPGYFESSLALDVERKDERYSIPLAFFGEGLIKLVNVLSIIAYYSKKRVMIDEIDTGIHYSRMRDFWKTILLAAKENDVQLFATTHNEECIRYFIEALEEIEKEQPGFQNLGKGINLFEVPESKDIKSITYSFSEFEHSFFAGNELRR